MELKHPLIKGKNRLKNQEGFTLIEIIAVLVILSILAVVAVPKYFDLQTEAKAKAMRAAIAEAKARVNQHFASELLNDTPVDSIEYTAATLGSDLGDFVLSVATDGITTTIDTVDSEGNTTTTTVPGIELTVSPKEGSAVAGAEDLTETIPKPGPL